jgi:hypothetical protein
MRKKVWQELCRNPREDELKFGLSAGSVGENVQLTTDPAVWHLHLVMELRACGPTCVNGSPFTPAA